MKLLGDCKEEWAQVDARDPGAGEGPGHLARGEAAAAAHVEQSTGLRGLLSGPGRAVIPEPPLGHGVPRRTPEHLLRFLPMHPFVVAKGHGLGCSFKLMCRAPIQVALVVPVEGLCVVVRILDGWVAELVVELVELRLHGLHPLLHLCPLDATVLGALHEPVAGSILGNGCQEVPRLHLQLDASILSKGHEVHCVLAQLGLRGIATA
mmetsp:Transcript_68348/g.154748  ORF Transcript_68348/g.154748 Transcript_68348/m.154748 type:complete len:207 (+) Transcript_68348:452-1072(+)